jgi:hypothetical protein
MLYKRQEILTAKAQRSRRKATDFDILILTTKSFLGALFVYGRAFARAGYVFAVPGI